MISLTIKQEAFCQAYIETGNASEAYRTAYAADKISLKQCTFKPVMNYRITLRLP